jgi:predicted RND superfamily exporter protein
LLVAGRPILFATLINASGFLALALSQERRVSLDFSASR